MFPDLLLNFDNISFEVRFAPGVVTSHIQVESIEMGEGRKRNKITNNENQTRNNTEKKIQFPIRKPIKIK